MVSEGLGSESDCSLKIICLGRAYFCGVAGTLVTFAGGGAAGTGSQIPIPLAQNQWDSAAEAYSEFQSAGYDYSRVEFFGPAQVQMCGDVSGLRVLDVGCGSGYMCRELSKQGAKVTGVDLSSKMVQVARVQSVDYGIEYVVLDAARIADHFNAESFDLATACISLQDMPEPYLTIKAVRHVLRQGSRSALS